MPLYAFRMLKTVKIPYISGKIAKLDGSGKVPTVECGYNKMALRFEAEDLFPMQIGEWISVRGEIRVDNRVNEDKLHEECPHYDENTVYIHDPMDESPRKEWLFFQLRAAEYRRSGPPDIIEALRECSNICRRFLDSWKANDNVNQLRELRQALIDAQDRIEPALKQRIIEEEEKNAKVKALDIQI